MQSFINNTFNDEQIKYRYVLDPDDKSELKLNIYQENDKHLNNKCPITMEQFKNGDSITKLPCGHLFNTDAIEEWLLNNQAKCPVCRHCLKNVKEIRITSIVPTVRDNSNNEELQINTDIGYDLNNINSILSSLFRNYLSLPLNNNAENVDISNNNEDNTEPSPDPITNNLNNYINMINTIVSRRIEEEDENIMQQVILESLQRQ